MYSECASKGMRIGAYLIDAVILSLMQAALALLAGPYGAMILGGVLSVCYYGVTEGSALSGSLGKYLCGLIVVDDQGRPLGYGKAFVRALCRVLSGLIFGIGFLIGLFSEDGRTLHDRIAGTFVAKREADTTTGTVHTPVKPHDAANNARIIGVTGAFAGKAFPVSTQGVMMGRDQTACDFVLSGAQTKQGISRMHCKIQFNPQTKMFILYDLGSTYGTFLGNGVRVAQGEPVALRSGDEFYLATRQNTFRVCL